MTMLRWLVTVTQHGPDGTVLLPGQVVTAPDDDPVVVNRAQAGMLVLADAPVLPAKRKTPAGDAAG